MTHLFDSYDLHGVLLANRMVMAPMTRTRADEGGVPNALMREYYVQRASAGLIVTECTAIGEDSAGIIHAPGIYSEEQVAGWRPVTDGVHAAGGRIFLQVWHCGRISHSSLQPDGELPVAPSAVAASGTIFTSDGPQPFETPRALDRAEIAPIIEAFGRAAANARLAGFDGVELHGAFGYLVDQFLQDGTNQRTDDYGGSVANRARFLLEVVDAMSTAWSANRIGVKLSPSSRFYGQSDTNALETFSHAARELDMRQIAYLHMMEPNEQDLATGTVQIHQTTNALRPFFSGPIITNGGYNKERAKAAIDAGTAELVSFGVPYIANPDLVRRFKNGANLAAPDPSTFYGTGPKGYIDFPPLEG